MIPIKPPVLGNPPSQYDAAYFNDMARKLRIAFEQLNVQGPLQVETLNISNLPTSTVGLKSGDIWVDTGAGNVLKVVP